MKALKILAGAALAVAAPAVAFSSPAQAAGTWGGAGTPVTLSTYNYLQTGYLPSAPAGASGTISSVSYNLNFTAPSYPRGALVGRLCSSSSNCTDVNVYGGTTSFFNGLPASTSLYFRVAWKDLQMSGSIKGGVNVTDSVSVSYS